MEIREAIGQVSDGVRKRGIWVMDRGGDRRHLYHYLLDNKLRFMIRVRADRGLRTAKGMASAVDLARSCPMLFNETMVREEASVERLVQLSFGMRKVRLPNRKEELTLVVTSYITRWRIEDVIRFIKQSYQLEDVRCLTYRRLQTLMVLVTAAAFFAAVFLGLRLRLRVLAGHVLRASKRLFGIPDFRLYALADGIKQFLNNRTRGLMMLLEQ